MKLIFEQQQFEYSQTASVEEIIEKINELLSKGYFFSHFIADGTEIYEDHETYLDVNLDRIETIEIIAKTEEEFLNDILLSAEDYSKQAKPELEALADGFYSNPTAETHNSFGQLMEGLQWLDEMLALIVESNVELPNSARYTELIQSLQAEIAGLGEAVENSDNVLTADIIQYELIPIFEQLEIAIGETIDTVGTRHDLS